MKLNMLKKIMYRYRLYVGILISCLVILVSVIAYASSAPSGFPRGKIVTIEKNSTVSEAAETLASLGIIRSPFLYKVFVTIVHDGNGVQAGKYLFSSPESTLRLAYRTSFGIRGLEKVKVTIPEGASSREMATLLSKSIKDFDGAEFYEIAKKKEGYLFPDTYFFDQGSSPLEVVRTMTTVFDEKIATIKDKIDMATTTSLKEIVIMASILEEEENNAEDRRVISGILWKRIKVGMPLQVDAPFYYLYQKGSSQLSKEDLTAASPYNTYKNKGLPAGPISNPSLDAILAAIEPKKSPYWFYLSDKTGQTHYAIDHDGHVANKTRYLR